jgi:hypothetical protein
MKHHDKAARLAAEALDYQQATLALVEAVLAVNETLRAINRTLDESIYPAIAEGR